MQQQQQQQAKFKKVGDREYFYHPHFDEFKEIEFVNSTRLRTHANLKQTIEFKLKFRNLSLAHALWVKASDLNIPTQVDFFWKNVEMKEYKKCNKCDDYKFKTWDDDIDNFLWVCETCEFLQNEGDGGDE